MTEILFYHLSKTLIEETLPSLVERSLARDWRVVLQFTTLELLEVVDKRLWTFSDRSFIAHGAQMNEFAPHQPVFLTLDAGANPNGAHIRFCLEGTQAQNIHDLERLVMMFDGHDEMQISKAREQWRLFKAQGADVTYWQQNDDRKWEKKA